MHSKELLQPSGHFFEVESTELRDLLVVLLPKQALNDEGTGSGGDCRQEMSIEQLRRHRLSPLPDGAVERRELVKHRLFRFICLVLLIAYVESHFCVWVQKRAFHPLSN